MFALLQDALPGGYGVALLQTLLALVAVCILAWVVLRWGAKKGLGLGMGGKRIKVLERVVLEPRRALYLVQLGDKVMLIGAGDGAAPAVLAELDAAKLPPEPEAPKLAFRDVLDKLRGRNDA